MACNTCKQFPVPTSQFELIEESIERHGTLYRCRSCGDYFELIAEERFVRFTSKETLARHYSKLRERTS